MFADDRECSVITDFKSSETNLKWRTVNDTVMGGRSSSSVQFADGKMLFKGEINTNGGGFTSIRFPLNIADLSDYSIIQLNLKSDARFYKLTFVSDARYRGRRVSFQGDIPLTPKGELTKVNVSLDNLQASLFGRKLRGIKFNKDKVVTMGIILADGVDGPFELEVESIMACKNQAAVSDALESRND